MSKKHLDSRKKRDQKRIWDEITSVTGIERPDSTSKERVIRSSVIKQSSKSKKK